MLQRKFEKSNIIKLSIENNKANITNTNLFLFLYEKIVSVNDTWVVGISQRLLLVINKNKRNINTLMFRYKTQDVQSVHLNLQKLVCL